MVWVLWGSWGHRVIGNITIRQRVYEFLLALYSIYVPILQLFGDKAIYQSKVVNFYLLTCIRKCSTSTFSPIVTRQTFGRQTIWATDVWATDPKPILTPTLLTITLTLTLTLTLLTVIWVTLTLTLLSLKRL